MSADKIRLRDALESVGMAIHEFEAYQADNNAPLVTALAGEAVVDETDFSLWLMAIRKGGCPSCDE